ncbi:hypothetical protein [Metabacillus litoralis]|uniref:hypothetical protein n=1 Tax=Metabacillus litoralis TaxID=152268 RepID=UPI00203A55D2|nr:hypothetical protein [Metabacillus litoralis]MCM3652924.1 hypothetical protein [Metabacillus litoralis]
MTREGILTACSTKPETIVQLIQTLFQRNHELEVQVQTLLQCNRELEAQGKKSTNSHLPPYSNWAPVPKASRPLLFGQKQKDYRAGNLNIPVILCD